LDSVHATPGTINLGNTTLVHAANTGVRLASVANNATAFGEIVSGFKNLYAQAIETVKNISPPSE